MKPNGSHGIHSTRATKATRAYFNHNAANRLWFFVAHSYKII